jgi:biopolymer transport protein ExbD
MPRNRDRGGEEEEGELNLVPFMNMVVVLIPMLLLSVVFLKIGVINITAPNLGPVKQPKQKEQDEDKKKKLDLTVTVGESGFYVAARDAREPPVEGCPDSGPTVCLNDDTVNIGDLTKQARSDFASGNSDAGQKKLRQIEDAYNWMALYNKLMEIKKMIEQNQDIKDTNVINITADPGIPYDLLIRTMDIARYKLAEDSYSNRDTFWKASLRDAKSEESDYALLFSQPVLSVAKN